MYRATSSAGLFCRVLMKHSNPSFSECAKSSCDSKAPPCTASSRALNPSSSVTRFFSRSTSPTISAPTFFTYFDHAVRSDVACAPTSENRWYIRLRSSTREASISATNPFSRMASTWAARSVATAACLSGRRVAGCK